MPDKIKLTINEKTYVATDEAANVFSPAFYELARVQLSDGSHGILYQHGYSQKLAIGLAHLSIADPLFAVYLKPEWVH